MAAFQAAVNAMPTAWLLAGQAIRVAQDLGLHVRPHTGSMKLADGIAAQPCQDVFCRKATST